MDVKEEIYRTVETIVERYVADQKQTEQVSGMVLNSLNGKYTVLVNGSKYVIKDGVGISPAPNTPVWICVPNNNWNQAYICAGKANTQGGTGNVKDVYQNNASVLGEDNIARIRCATPEDIQQLQANFQDGVDAIGNACIRKGSTPASSSLEDTVAAIDAIQTGGNYMTKEIREDGTYYASDDGVDAYDIVVVSKDVGQPHTVVFYGPDGNILKTEMNVPYHGYATCTSLDGTTRQGLYFKGWNPSPTNIIRDTFCYPQYGDYIIEPNETLDSWETICAVKGAGYPLGTRKALVISTMADSGTFTDFLGADHSQRFTTNFQMVKVAEGESGSTSTWISTGAIYLNPSDYFKNITPSSNNDGYQYATTNGAYGSELRTCGWKRCDMRYFLNQAFLRNLPESLSQTIKEVTKYSRDRISLDSTTLNNDMETIDKIWLLSERELKSLVETNFGSMIYTPSHLGIDYSTVYVGNYGYGLATRDCYYSITNEIKYSGNFSSRSDRYWYWGNDASFVFGFCL